ncbi:MAG TPA: PilT/PilU family type 4a pilus ATPase [Acidimicrobiales bacterium]|nr:PilT/PilU family type 4a pilus ATPase [Acidimicrobiales bacterium]
MQSASRQLGELLVDKKVLSRDTMENLLVREEAEGVAFMKILTAEGLVSEKDLTAAIAAKAGFDFVDFNEINLNPKVDGLIPPDMAAHYRAVAIDITDDHLRVAMMDPSDASSIEEMAKITGFAITPVMADRRDLERILRSLYGEQSVAVSTADVSSGISGSQDADFQIVKGELHINELLTKVVENNGSDLHLTVGIHPTMRLHGEMTPMTEYPKLSGSETRRLIFAILTQRQRERFETDKELDTAHAVPGCGRFRVNVFYQRDSVGGVMRSIPYEIVPLENLGLPPSVAQFAELPRGLILVTGPTGSGKSTSLASLIDIVNSTKRSHIITVEDPIEFLHRHKLAVVNQREVGEDTHSFSEALKHALRQDPDVILVGEMRDLETISTALTAAETGHLVFATLHTQDAPQSVDRVIDVFPAHQQQQIRTMLASALQGIVTQQLLPLAGRPGRAVASEVLVCTPAVRNLIREGKTHQIYSAMQAGGKYGMQTMDMSLATLVRRSEITLSTAIERCSNEEDLKRLAGVTE